MTIVNRDSTTNTNPKIIHISSALGLITVDDQYKGTYASVQLCKRMDCTCRNTVANGIRVIVRVYLYGKILGEDHDRHEQSI